MKQRVAHLFAVAVPMLALTLGAVRPAFGGPASDAVQQWRAAIVGLVQPGVPSNRQKIDAIRADSFDYQACAKALLGSEWAARSAAEQAQFTGLFKMLVRKFYLRKLGRIAGLNVHYLSEVPMVGGDVIVNGASVPPTIPC